MSTTKGIRRCSLTNPELAIKIIEQDGGVIFTDFTTPELVEKVNQDARQYFQHNLDQTQRCSRLWGRSETAREVWAQQPPFVQIMNHFIKTCVFIDIPPRPQMDTDPILSYSGTFNIGPGAPEQVTHRDDTIWQQVHKNQEVSGYEVGSDIGVSLMIPGMKTTEENGATVFYLGSHLWEHERKPNRSDAVYAEMDVGEAFFFLSSTVHAGGANKTNVPRPGHGLFFCRSYIRPEENLHVWFTEEEVRTWSSTAQRQAGFLLDSPFLGHVDHHNAIDKFRACKEPAVVATMV